VRSKTPSSGDQLLLDELARRRCSVSLTQIERWRYWRKTGLVPRTIQHGRGRGSYSELPNLSEAAARVCEISQLLNRLDSLDEVALVLAARGRPLEPASVKAALLAVLASMERDFRSHKPVSNDPHEIAHNAARALKRAMGRTTGDRAPAPASASTKTLAIAGRALMGIPVPTHDLQTFLDESRIAEVAVNLGWSRVALTSYIESVLPHCSHAAVQAFAERQQPEAIVQALQTVNRLIDSLVPPAFFPGETSRDVAVVTAALGMLAGTNLAQPMNNTD
jgi:hypothetical protein